jgi:C_GCAxxG_C_C family probable redox protein
MLINVLIYYKKSESYEDLLTVDEALEMKKKTRSELAMSFFKEGYNCSQSVFMAFCDEYDMDFDMALKISSSFGGGMGRLREVCGAVTGMFMTAGMIYGYSDPKDHILKTEHYKRIQYLAKEFEEKNHSIICRELLGLGSGKDIPVPELRTAEYYKKRPCVELVGMAADIMDKYIKDNQQSKSVS